MSAFDTVYPFTLALEGGLSKNPVDPAARDVAPGQVHTNRGVRQSTYDAFRKRRGLPLRSVALMTDDETYAIYRTQYWDAVVGDSLPPRTAMALFDYTVHSGEGVSGKALQRLVGATPDGDVGPKTAAAARAKAPTAGADRELAFRLMVERALQQGKWIAANASRAQFAPGFMRRLVELGALVARF